MQTRDLLSLVVPCYNEEAALPLFYEAVCGVMGAMPEQDFELILVNDGSRDGTLALMRQLAVQDARVKYISFSRNFGKEAAMLAGFEHAAGNYIAVMDADLQDPPSLLPEMYAALCTGSCDCVATRRVDRKGEPPIRSFFARMFYRLINRLSKTEVVDGARDFRLMTRQMVDAILAMPEYNRFSKGIFGWVGFETKWIEFQNTERIAGETKWSFWKLFLYSIDGIIAFSTAPLAISSFAGILFCLVSFIMIVFIIVRRLMFFEPTTGWASTVCIILMVSGVQLFCIGVLGQYMSKTYLESKHRPIYIVKESNTARHEEG